MKQDIDMNTNLRNEGKNDSGEFFFKLMNNSFFGETIENLREYNNRNEKKLFSVKTTLLWYKVFHKVCSIEMRKNKILFAEIYKCHK